MEFEAKLLCESWEPVLVSEAYLHRWALLEYVAHVGRLSVHPANGYQIGGAVGDE